MGGVNSALGVGGGENSEDERHCQDGLQAPAGCLTYVENIGAATTGAPAVLVNLSSSKFNTSLPCEMVSLAASLSTLHDERSVTTTSEEIVLAYAVHMAQAQSEQSFTKVLDGKSHLSMGSYPCKWTLAFNGRAANKWTLYL